MKLFRYLSLIFTLFIALIPWADSSAAKWEVYSAFDNNPVRIIDTPGKTYILAHQQYYKKKYNGYDFPSLALFVSNKADINPTIESLITDTKLSASDIKMADYSPAGDYLLVAHLSGNIDLIDAEGKVSTISTLSQTQLPGASRINSVTFDPSTGDAYVATDCGWIHIDALSKTVSESVSHLPHVQWVAKVGDQIAVISEGTLYISSNSTPKSSAELTQLSGGFSPLALMPLSDHSFAILSGTAGGNVSVILAKKENNNWEVSSLGADKLHALGNDFVTAHNYETNLIPNRDGYLLFSASKAWQLTRGSSSEDPALYSLNLTGVTLPLGSWDMKNFLAYKDRGTFQRYNADYGTLSSNTAATWSENGSPVRPNVPATFIAPFIAYSPEFGHLMINHGQIYAFRNDTPTTPLLLSAKKGDSWNVLSQAYTAPYSVENNQDLRNIYNAYKYRFPVADPQGLLVDPINPDWISTGSMWGGLIFMNIRDPKKDVIHFAAPNDLFRAFPGYISTTPLQTWGTLSSFSNTDVDNDNRIWTISGNPYENPLTKARNRFFYMTPEKRAAFYSSDINDVAQLPSWSEIDIPNDRCAVWHSLVLCCKHPRNRNRVIAFFGGDGEFDRFAILDHKGHPENVTKADFKTALRLQNDKGWSARLRRVNSIAEDPNNGDIVIAGLDGLFILDPDSEPENNTMRGDFMQLIGGASGDIVPTKATIFKILFDSEGRMWIGTSNMGIIGVNKDRTEVFARYNTENSPLPSDEVVGLGWNPATSSLLISTTNGIAEVFPDLSNTADWSNSPAVSPSSVSPGYNGIVEIRNVNPAESIVIHDLDGNEIRRLETDGTTIAVWDLKDNSGKPVGTGHYNITVGEHHALEIPVIR